MVSKEKIIKLILINVGIVLLNVIVFSPGLINLTIGGESALKTALAITIILMSVITFFVGNYSILTSKEKKIVLEKLETKEDLIKALRDQDKKRTFFKNIQDILKQVDRFEDKRDVIKDILLQKFNEGELTYQKFNSAVVDIERIFYLNIKSIINKINIFDEEDYFRISKDANKGNVNIKLIKEKLSIYNSYIVFVKEAIEDNEEILLRLDKFLLELSKFNSLEDGQIEYMNEVKEIEELISKVKFYK